MSVYDAYSPITLLSAFLDTIEHSLLPLTMRGVSSGSKVFGAAILSKHDLNAITIATNDEATSPLLHGEVNCIQQFYTFPPPNRPGAKDCLFLTTHEPCSLCLSAITWAGFDNFTYFFTYEDTRDAFDIPHDIDILQSVFQVNDLGDGAAPPKNKSLYNKQNKFFHAMSIAELLAAVEDESDKQKFEQQIGRIRKHYAALAGQYAEGKGGKDIPLS